MNKPSFRYPKKQILVLGIGNLLMGDEGVGVHVVRKLQKDKDLDGVDIVDGGTGGLGLLEYFLNHDLVILIDATMDGNPPGSLRWLKPAYAADYPLTMGSHDIGLKDVLDALRLLGKKPEIILVAVSIESMDRMTLELSAQIQGAVAAASKEIKDYLMSVLK
jgi:hydrogenase maturation protease